MKYIFLGSQGLQAWQFRQQGECVAELSLKDWPTSPEARACAAKAVVVLLNMMPYVTHVMFGVNDDERQVCNAHATSDEIRFSGELHWQTGRPGVVFQVVKVPQVDCSCLDGQPAVAGAFACPALHLRRHGTPAPQLLTVDLTHTLQGG